MAKLYARLIKAKKWKLKDVPAMWYDEVKELLDDDVSPDKGLF